VDPVAGRHKIHHGKFIFGSGLSLPIQSGSMDFVHTNQLFHALRDPSSPSRPFKQSALLVLAEIARVLAPGGQLLMKERPPSLDKASTPWQAREVSLKLGRFIATALDNFGIGYVVAELPAAPKGVAYMLDPTRNFARHQSGQNAAAVAIFAQKRPRGMYALSAA
jgi:SAM-dependent methyltransferase